MLKKFFSEKLWKALILFVFISYLTIGNNSDVQASDPLYPNLKVLPPRDLRFDRTDVSVDNSGDLHNVLRFSNTVYNNGEGKMEMWGDINPNTKEGTAYQRVYNSDGSIFADYSVGRFYYHAQHDHYHFEDWGQYQLWTKAEYDLFVSTGGSDGDFNFLGSKTTSCVLDEEFILTLPNSPVSGVYPYTGCIPNAQNKLLEGLSVSWGDTYDYYRFEQWIDLGQTTLADGDYVLCTLTDPTNKMYESAGKADGTREGLGDNAAITPVKIIGGQLVDSLPPSGTVAINNVSPVTLVKNVTVKVVGRDDVSGVDQVMLSNDGITWATYAYTGVQSAAQSISWDLTNPAYGGNTLTGIKTVYAKFHDISGKTSAIPDTDSITYGTVSQTSDYSDAIIADAPVNYWRLSEASGTTAFDSMGANLGTYNNSPTLGVSSLLISDSASKSVTFDGVNDYVSTSNVNNFASAVSVEAWIKPIGFPSSSAYASVASKSNSYTLQFGGSRLEFKLANSRLQAPINAISLGQTYHVVGTYNGTTQKLYINGIEVASKALTGAIPTNTSNFRIGAFTSSTELFNGTIDDVALYNYALISTKVKNHFDVGAGNIVIAPETQINSQPASLTNNTAADFAFSSSSPTVTFECSLDDAFFSACVSPKQLTGLSNSLHNFQVRAKDSVGNTDATPASYSWTVDSVSPTVTSFTRQVPASSSTNANTLIFRVTFNESMLGVGIPDFAINGTTTAMITKVGVVNVSVYDVTITGGNLASLEGVIGLNFNAPTITDLAGNALAAVEPSIDETYTLDNTAPTITSFIRQAPSTSTTSVDTLVFRAAFNEGVTGVSAADFAVNGSTTAVVTHVNSVNTSVYDITVAGGDLATFNGMVGLNFNSPSIVDLVGNSFVNAEPVTDETYIVQNDAAAPAILSFVRQTPASSLTNVDALVFRATFNEAVTGVGTLDFAVNGSTTAAVTNVNVVTTSVYDVTISGGNLAALNGAVGLNFNSPSIVDLDGNSFSDTEPTVDETYTLDNTAPTITSFLRQTPSASTTSADTLVFRTTFNEDVSGVSTADFAINGSTTATVTNVNSVSASVYDVTVSGGNLASFNGVVGLSFNSPSITDLAGNSFVNAEPATDEIYTVQNDVTAPTITSFLRQTPSASTTSADTLVFRSTFSEDVSGISTADFAINGSTTATVTNVNSVSASVYDVTVSGGDLASFNGVVGLNFNSPSIADLAGNAFVNAEPAMDETYIVQNDVTAPTITSFVRQTPSDAMTGADTLIFRATFNEDVTGISTADFAINGSTTATVTNVNSVSASVYDVTVLGGDLASFNGVVGLNFNSPTIVDLSNNAFINVEPTIDQTYVLENTAPTVTGIIRAGTSPTPSTSVNFTVNFSKPVTGVTADDFNLTTSVVSGAAVSGVSGSGSSYTVTVNTGAGNGTIRLDLVNNNSIKDATLNILAAGFTSGEVYTILKPSIFIDVPSTYWASSYIERLYNAGITNGCSSGYFCPESTVTRVQMAIFLLKATYGASYVPPVVGGSTGFADIAIDYWGAAWIKQLAAEGITSGCGGGNFCPEATVTRAQMAIFLLKAKHGSAYNPPAAVGVFSDVPVGHWADKWIEGLAAEGISSGCGAGIYCPDAEVTRAQMAIFLVKAFNLP